MSIVKTRTGRHPSVFLDTTAPRRPRLVIEVSPKERATIEDALETLAHAENGISVQTIILEALRTAVEQDYFWTPGWQGKERAADQAIADGRVRTFDTMDEMLDFLDAQ